ncbi:hypothetical protein VTN02DRAFT_2132 [Thermoascus thermophilus]
MLTPILLVAVAFAIAVALHATLAIQHLLLQRQHARALGCQPPRKAANGVLGIPGFLRMARSVREKRWLYYLQEQYRLHGTTFAANLFGRTVVMTIEPENLRALLATRFHDFGLGTRHREFYPLLGDGIFTLDGAGWSHARALLRPQFTRDQVADLALLDAHVSRMIDLVPRDGAAFDIQRLFYRLTMDSATHFLFGESVGSLLAEPESTADAQGFAEAFALAQDYLVARSRAQDLYWLVNPRRYRAAIRTVHDLVDRYVRLALEQRQQQPEPEQQETKANRYIFLRALAAETQDPKVLRDNLLNVLLAGRDTTASLLSSTVYLLARHPAVWRRLREVVVGALAEEDKEGITHARLKDIPYLRYVLNEALRLYPPVPLNFRVATTDTALPVGGGPDQTAPVYVRRGTIVAYNVFAMHRRTDLWGADAHVFRPERWAEKKNARRGWDYLPFNGGARICLGQQYALTEASYTLVRLMQQFDTLEMAEPMHDDDDDEPVLVSTLTMSHDRGVRVRLYSGSNLINKN